MSPKKAPEIDFHQFALRLPKVLYHLLNEMAWITRTSINVQILDLITSSLLRYWFDLIPADEKGSPELEHQFNPEDYGIDNDSHWYLERIVEGNAEALYEALGSPVLSNERLDSFIDYLKSYPKWREKR